MYIFHHRVICAGSAAVRAAVISTKLDVHGFQSMFDMSRDGSSDDQIMEIDDLPNYSMALSLCIQPALTNDNMAENLLRKWGVTLTLVNWAQYL